MLNFLQALEDFRKSVKELNLILKQLKEQIIKETFMRERPLNALDNMWGEFETWADENGIGTDTDDWTAWWNCWVTAVDTTKIAYDIEQDQEEEENLNR